MFSSFRFSDTFLWNSFWARVMANSGLFFFFFSFFLLGPTVGVLRVRLQLEQMKRNVWPRNLSISMSTQPHKTTNDSLSAARFSVNLLGSV